MSAPRLVVVCVACGTESPSVPLVVWWQDLVWALGWVGWWDREGWVWSCPRCMERAAVEISRGDP